MRFIMQFWTDKEIETLKQRYPTTFNNELCKILGKTISSIINKAHRLRLKKSDVFLNEFRRKGMLRAKNAHLELGDYRLWSDAEKQELIKLYNAGEPTPKIADRLKRSESATRNMMKVLRLLGRDKRRVSGLKAEKLAQSIMEQQGWRIIQKGGNNLPFDYIAEVNGEIFVIDVKSGTLNEDISAFMRFLALPYKHAFIYVVLGKVFFMPVYDIKMICRVTKGV